jgi:monomeric sarcosine oxidase
MDAYRYGVIGAGGIGSAAAYWLSRRAPREVVCLEQYDLGHGRGASEDHSRIIRLGYHSPAYTALTRDAYAAWRAVEAESGVPLVHITGMVNVARSGTAGAAILDGYVAAMEAYDIGHERLDAAELTRRYPQFRVADDHEALFQPDGGILDIRRAVAVLQALARANGTAFVERAPVTAIADRDGEVELATPRGPVRAERVLLCAGAWNRALLRGLGVDWPIQLTHEQVTYFATPNLRAFAPGRFPIWIWHGEDEYYGFPVYGEAATKAAQERLGPPIELDDRAWDRDPERVREVRAFVDEVLPGFSGPELYTRCCLYDMPPDRDFVVDFVPGHGQIAVCVGAGHAAKFASLLGRILSELVLDGGTRSPIGPFAADRPALTDPGFRAGYRLGAALAG